MLLYHIKNMFLTNMFTASFNLLVFKVRTLQNGLYGRKLTHQNSMNVTKIYNLWSYI